jgi:hypothetical protein
MEVTANINPLLCTNKTLPTSTSMGVSINQPIDESRHSPCECALDCHALVSGLKSDERTEKNWSRIYPTHTVIKGCLWVFYRILM